ncbi:LysM peptidoglycan-binding domain-containing protein [Arthrobacter sp. CJ23]|uniref:LysM peptidoglycan-binding domain-containing protein n=1 Tax=Arthrobacter sp. CJ23 TaxID=2972479 RepID=UPI0037C03F8D
MGKGPKFLLSAIAILAVILLLVGINWVGSLASVMSTDNSLGAATEQSAPPASPAAANSVPATAPSAQPVESSAAEAATPAAPAEAAPAAPVEAAPVPAAPAPDSNLYTVVPGDTVGAIAARFGVDMNAMLAANGLGGYSVIVPGQTLKLTGPAIPLIDPVPAPAPAAAAPAPAAQAAAPAPAAPAPAAAPAPVGWTIYVAGSGGQALVDACIGPIHFTPTDAYSLFITEHDFCGGWGRFSGIGVGQTVTLAGYGTYTVSARGQVPLGGTTDNVAAVFGGFPRAVLQTCIPGTSQMLVIALN